MINNFHLWNEYSILVRGLDSIMDLMVFVLVFSYEDEKLLRT